MPRIEKPKKLKKKVKSLPKKLSLPTKVKTTTKKVKHSPVEYYNCLLTQAQNDWFDPQTGKKKKITACCKDCKSWFWSWGGKVCKYSWKLKKILL